MNQKCGNSTTQVTVIQSQIYLAVPSTTSFEGLPDFFSFFSVAPLANAQPCTEAPDGAGH